MAQGFPLVGSMEPQARRSVYSSQRGQLWSKEHQRRLERPRRWRIQVELAKFETQLYLGTVQRILFWLPVGSPESEFCFHQYCWRIPAYFALGRLKKANDSRDSSEVREALPEKHREIAWKTDYSLDIKYHKPLDDESDPAQTGRFHLSTAALNYFSHCRFGCPWWIKLDLTPR